MIFYPRSPCGERPFSLLTGLLVALFFYPRSPCGERLAITDLTLLPFHFSIHALLAESDDHHGAVVLRHNTFLSTLSLRRATKTGRLLPSNYLLFYPRSPCGERPRQTSLLLQGSAFSIHALLAESDSIFNLGGQNLNVFLSTLSLRRATLLPKPTPRTQPIFYPRSPCGERL